MTQALNRTAHIARVAQIFKPCQTQPSLLASQADLVPVIYRINSSAFLRVELAVILQTFCATIGYLHAFAMEVEGSLFLAIFTLRKNFRVLKYVRRCQHK